MMFNRNLFDTNLVASLCCIISFFLIFRVVSLSFLVQSEYQRGVSAWNFDVEDLKAQASLVCHILLFSSYQHDDICGW